MEILGLCWRGRLTVPVVLGRWGWGRGRETTAALSTRIGLAPIYCTVKKQSKVFHGKHPNSCFNI